MASFLFFLIVSSVVVSLIASLISNMRMMKHVVYYLVFSFLLLLWLMVKYSAAEIDMSNQLFILFSHLEMILMLSFAPVYLIFVHSLLNQKENKLLITIVSLNFLGILVRYLIPMDTTIDNFWRISDPVLGSLFATVFTIPMIYAIYLLIKNLKTTTDNLVKNNLKINLIGIIIATVFSVVSEFVLPVLFKVYIDLPLIDLAIVLFSLFIYYAMMKYSFLEMNLGNIYEELFEESNSGIIIINEKGTISRMNAKASEILEISSTIDTNDNIFNYLQDYHLDQQYDNTLIKTVNGNSLALSQSLNKHLEFSQVIIINDYSTYADTIKTLEDETLIDYLTQIPNRKAFFNDVYQFVQEEDYILVMLDLNNFKNINDTYGHDKGDEVLIAFSKKITSCIDLHGHAYRLGGDEFALLIASTSSINFKVKFDRIEQFLKQYDKTLGIARGIVPINKTTVNSKNKIEESMKIADNMMYEQKRESKK